jgi:hypothetical protein
MAATVSAAVRGLWAATSELSAGTAALGWAMAELVSRSRRQTVRTIGMAKWRMMRRRKRVVYQAPTPATYPRKSLLKKDKKLFQTS